MWLAIVHHDHRTRSIHESHLRKKESDPKYKIIILPAQNYTNFFLKKQKMTNLYMNMGMQ